MFFLSLVVGFPCLTHQELFTFSGGFEDRPVKVWEFLTKPLWVSAFLRLPFSARRETKLNRIKIMLLFFSSIRDLFLSVGVSINLVDHWEGSLPPKRSRLRMLECGLSIKRACLTYSELTWECTWNVTSWACNFAVTNIVNGHRTSRVKLDSERTPVSLNPERPGELNRAAAGQSQRCRALVRRWGPQPAASVCFRGFPLSGFNDQGP